MPSVSLIFYQRLFYAPCLTVSLPRNQHGGPKDRLCSSGRGGGKFNIPRREPTLAPIPSPFRSEIAKSEPSQALGGAAYPTRYASRSSAQAQARIHDCSRKGGGIGARKNKPGDYLLSRSLAESLPSALGGLTSEFGMGSGVSPPVWSPGN